MFFIIIAASVCVLDLCLKRYIDRNKKENCREPAAGGHIIISRVHNSGAFMGLLKDKPRILLGITIFAFAVITAGFTGSLHSECPAGVKFGLALITGGAASNTIDRIADRRVTDYFRFSTGSRKLERIVFNLGDMAVFFGALITVLGGIGHQNGI